MEEIIPARLAMVSHFAFGSPALYLSVLNFINTGDSAVALDMVAQVDRGGRFGARRTLSPGQGFREDVTSLFQIAVGAVFPPPMLTGYIRIREADGGIFQGIGDIDITREANAASMLYPVGAALSSSSTMPFVINDSDYFTGYAIAVQRDHFPDHRIWTTDPLRSEDVLISTAKSAIFGCPPPIIIPTNSGVSSCSARLPREAFYARLYVTGRDGRRVCLEGKGE